MARTFSLLVPHISPILYNFAYDNDKYYNVLDKEIYPYLTVSFAIGI